MKLIKLIKSLINSATSQIIKSFCIAALFLLFINFAAINIYAQANNSISGYVFDLRRQPLGDINVELLDDYSRSVARTRTSAAGRYQFNRLPAGRYRIRVLSGGTDYGEQEQEVEIVNITRETPGGNTIVSGSENVQRDFYLKPRKENPATGRAEAVFVQQIPEKAKETYLKALELLDNKNEEALKQLKLAIEIFPDYFDAIERLGIEYVKLRHYQAAEILLNRAVQINPRAYKSWYGLAYARYSQNKTNDALEAIQKAVSLNQLSVEALLLEGVLHRKAKDYKQAEKLLKKAKDAAKGGAEVAEVHWHLALLYGNDLNRYGDAADELEAFLKAQPENKNAENIKKLIKKFREKAASK